MAKLSVLDLTAGQVETIEADLGLPVSQWSAAPSIVAVYVKIMAAANGDGEEKYRAMTMRELLAQVSLDEAEDPKASARSRQSSSR